MRVVLQRVSKAKVKVQDDTIASIDRGYLLLVGITHNDSTGNMEWMANKIANLRLFEDENGKLNLPISSVDGRVLAVSQFTLYGDTRKGRRPSFTAAAPPEMAEPLFTQFTELLRQNGIQVETGEFGAHMHVELANDGPVTLVLERQ